MNQTDACPTNLTEVAKASKRLECGQDFFGNNQYMCLPDVKKTSLFEFCYDGIMGIQEKGNCLEVNVSDGTLNLKKCTSFSTGCPSNHYWNYDFFKYPACQNISLKHRCYLPDPSCLDLHNKDFNDADLNTKSFEYKIFAIIMILSIAILTVVLCCIWRRRKRKTSKAAKLDEDNMKEFLNCPSVVHTVTEAPSDDWIMIPPV